MSTSPPITWPLLSNETVWDKVQQGGLQGPPGPKGDKGDPGEAGSGGGGISDGVDVSSFATDGDGTKDTPWIGWDTAITWSPRTRYIFKTGYFAFDTSPNYLQEGIELIGSPGTYLLHTGTGNGFVMDAGPSVGSVWIQNARVENIIVLGNPVTLTGNVNVDSGSADVVGSGTLFSSEIAVGDSVTWYAGTDQADSYVVQAIPDDTHITLNRNATVNHAGAATVTKTRNGFFLRGVRNAAFDRLAVHDIGGAALWSEGCVTNSLRLFRCTYHEPTQGTQFKCRPQYGIVIAGRGADWSTCWFIEEPVIEGMQLIGIWLRQDSYGATLINGTSEGNIGKGIQVDGNSNQLIGVDVEGNGGDDITVHGSLNYMISIESGGLVHISDALVGSGAYGSRNQILMSNLQNLTIDAGGYLNQIIGGFINADFTDNANGTIKLGMGRGDERTKIAILRPFTADVGAGPSMDSAIKIANVFRVLANADCVLNAPGPDAYPDSEQTEISYQFRNDSGSTHSITWNAGDGGFVGLPDTPLPVSIATGTSIYVRVRFSAYLNRWVCVGVAGAQAAGADGSIVIPGVATLTVVKGRITAIV